MKQLVDSMFIHGWRKPSDKEKDAIKSLVKEYSAEMAYYLIWSLITIVGSITLLKFSLGLILKSTLRSIIMAILVIVAASYVVLVNCKLLNKAYKIKKIIELDLYSVETCYINRIEYKISFKDYGIKREILAYVHNEIGEYCKEPIEIGEEVESVAKYDRDTKFLLVKFNKVYRILDVY